MLLGDAERRLRLPGEAGLDKAIHESRKRIKEVRGLLRVFRKSLVDEDGQPVRDWANDLLRSAAQPMGPAREAAVARETLKSLDLQDNPLVSKLQQRHADVIAAGAGDAATDAATIVARVRASALTWRLDGDGFDAASAGLNRLYGKGRRAMADAFASSGDIEAWHDWRKRAKDLRYALEYFEPAAPTLLEPMRSLAKAVTDHLGRDHDLAELAEVAEAEGDEAVAKAASAARTNVQSETERLGRLVWAETPAAFVHRVKAYWTAAVDQTTR